MTQYIVVHSPTQLITKVITTPQTPAPENDHTFHEVSIIVLNHYYALFKKALAQGVQVSVDELMNSSPTFMKQISGNCHNLH